MTRVVGRQCLPRHRGAIVARLYQTPISLNRRFTETPYNFQFHD